MTNPTYKPGQVVQRLDDPNVMYRVESVGDDVLHCVDRDSKPIDVHVEEVRTRLNVGPSPKFQDPKRTPPKRN